MQHQLPQPLCHHSIAPSQDHAHVGAKGGDGGAYHDRHASDDTRLQVLYCCAVVCVLDYAHDGWFYWTHRLLHWRPLYKHVHYIHHKSTAPTAYTGYSFHLLEALIVFANEVLVCFLFPIHVGVHRGYHLFTTVIHNGGHAGYEIAPFIPSIEQLVVLVMNGPRGSRALNTVQHHDMHHRYPTKHFSLYFTHWDR
jgi:Delta7-sterol 5-desaturase